MLKMTFLAGLSPRLFSAFGVLFQSNKRFVIFGANSETSELVPSVVADCVVGLLGLYFMLRTYALFTAASN